MPSQRPVLVRGPRENFRRTNLVMAAGDTFVSPVRTFAQQQDVIWGSRGGLLECTKFVMSHLQPGLQEGGATHRQ